MSGTIELSSHDQWRLTIALELEHHGFNDAAKCLRDKVLPLRGVDWKDEVAPHIPVHINWVEVFRAHRGSVSPVETAPEDILHGGQS